MSFDKDIIFGRVKAQLNKKNKGYTFAVSDLLYGFDEYDKLSKVDKLLFGRLFKNEVELGNIKNVVLTGNKINNKIEYKKR